MLDANFEGYEPQRAEFLRMPKYGNDHQGVDELHREIANKLNHLAYDKAEAYGLDFFLNCNLNPGGAIYGDNTCATADGRLEGVSFALGNCPTAGMDTAGLTALLNSMARPVEKHGGNVYNLKLSMDLFSDENRPKLMMLLKSYFGNGGMQLMMTALNKDDLEKAMENPQEYRDLMVRVAGWTGRFVEQESYLQKEIIERTFYC
jgi:pyruvate-formate lyase